MRGGISFSITTLFVSFLILLETPFSIISLRLDEFFSTLQKFLEILSWSHDQSPGELSKAVQRTLSWSGSAAPYLAQQLPMATSNNADPMNQDQALSEASGASSSSTAPPSARKQAIR